MPKLLGLPAAQLNQSLQGFDYTSVAVEKLEATEYTVVSIVVDKTGSVEPFKKELENMLSMSLESCKKSARVLNLIARSTAFNAPSFSSKPDIEEIHGFVPLNSIDTSKFTGTINPDGATPLYEASLEAVDTLYDYAKKLYDKQILSNAIVFIITDGDDNASSPSSTPDAIKKTIEKIRREEVLESIRVILIGINDTDTHFKTRLDTFKKEANLDEYVSVGEATPGKLAKLAQFVSRSTSSTSQSLGSGGPSQPVSFTF
jgi:hypothetical protein